MIVYITFIITIDYIFSLVTDGLCYGGGGWLILVGWEEESVAFLKLIQVVQFRGH